MMSTFNLTARLYTDGGGWGLPTIEAEGLAAHAMFRFAHLEYAAIPGASPTMTPANKLPVAIFELPASVYTDGMEEEPVMSAGLPSLIATFTATPFLPDLNKNLTPFMTAESTAFGTLVMSRFDPARRYEFFVDDANYSDIYHSLLLHKSPFPLNRIVPYMRRLALTSGIRSSNPEGLYFDAGIALAALSTRLGEHNKYFYGDDPSILDAVVFGQLATALLVPLPNARLRVMIASHGNLVAFVERVHKEFFADQDEVWHGALDPDAIAQLRREEAERRARDASQNTRASRAGEDAPMSQEDADRKRGNLYFVWGAVAVFAAHLLLGSEMEYDMG